VPYPTSNRRGLSTGYATPTVQRGNANQAEATDLASVINLANGLRTELVEKGLIKGEA